MTGKRLRIIIQQLLLIFYILKKKNHVQLIFQKLIRIVKSLMILNQEKESWHYLVVKGLSALLRGIPSKHDGEFYCLNCLHSFRTENRDNILIFNQYTKSDKMPYIIYVVFEYLIKKQIAVQTIKKNLQHQN